jgi:hypothetical protein
MRQSRGGRLPGKLIRFKRETRSWRFRLEAISCLRGTAPRSICFSCEVSRRFGLHWRRSSVGRRFPPTCAGYRAPRAAAVDPLVSLPKIPGDRVAVLPAIVI